MSAHHENGRPAPAPTVHGDDTFRRRLELLDVAGDIVRHLDFSTVAQRAVDAVLALTGSGAAVLAVCETDSCRIIATGGSAQGLGSTTDLTSWQQLLREEYRIGATAFLVPADSGSVISVHGLEGPGAVVGLHDERGDAAGFLAAAQLGAGLLDDPTTLQSLEVLARQAEIAMVNARLFDLTRRQADTMEHLFEFAKAVVNATDFDALVPDILGALQRRLDPFIAALAVRHDDVLDVARADRGSNQIRRVAEGADGVVNELLERLADAGDVLVIGDANDWPELRERATPGTRSLCGVAARELDGVDLLLAVTSDRPHAFDAEAVGFVRGVLDCATAALRNAQLYNEVRMAAERDPLTGLRNRRVFWSFLSGLVKEASPESPLAVAVLDIDNFKHINDELGHDAGDRALVHVAHRLEANVRETDAVFRVGGEEFVLVMPDTNVDGARLVLERVSSAIKTSRVELPRMTVSAGIATIPGDATTSDAVVNAADAALYEAKRLGKDRTELASSRRG